MSFREGPGQAKLDKTAGSTGSLAFSSENLEVRNNGSNIESARANVHVKAGCWYYETTVQSAGTVYIGWCTSKFKGDSKKNEYCGGDKESWGFDGSRSTPVSVHDKAETGYGKKWTSGQVVGCALDVDKKEISYYLNGVALGVAYNNITIPSDGLFPCVSLAKRERVIVNFGKTDFQYPVAGLFGLHSQLGPEGLKKLEKLFDKYKQLGIKEGDSTTNDAVQPMGLTKFCEDLGMDPDGIDFLMLSWKLNTKTPYEVSRMEFLGGFDALNAADIAPMKKRMNEVRTEMNDIRVFRKFYQFCFDFVKPTPTAKGIDLETASATWSSVLSTRFKLLPQFMDYTATLPPKTTVSRDTWKMLLEFAEKIGSDIKKYAADDAWPVMIEEFYEWMMAKQ
eukprot:TRINITY_DN1229_c1_g1_i1.p1 TRINITY_DN1229_c1_g1~~TRINITY_DN1229_c1_g1_i1.p1  ORF type:complete len:393 (-),score=85.64 TRINITY_DN1229_c1_g1_i1:17-1195(-)